MKLDLSLITRVKLVEKFVDRAFNEALVTYHTPDLLFSNNVKSWLSKIFNLNGDPDSRSLQFGICMAIDLRSHSQSVNAFLHILEEIQFDKLATDVPYCLFEDAAKLPVAETYRFSLHSQNSYPAAEDQLARVIPLGSYLRYIIFAYETSWAGKSLGDLDNDFDNGKTLEDVFIDDSFYLNTDDPLPLFEIEGKLSHTFRIMGGPPQWLNWVVPYQQFKHFLDKATIDCTEGDIAAITLGRPVEVDDLFTSRYQVYLRFPHPFPFTTYQPTAINGAWDSKFPYISYHKEDAYGRAFNLRTGTTEINYNLVGKERILGDIPASIKNADPPYSYFAYSLKGAAHAQIHNNLFVIIEALERFEAASGGPLPEFIVYN